MKFAVVKCYNGDAEVSVYAFSTLEAAQAYKTILLVNAFDSIKEEFLDTNTDFYSFTERDIEEFLIDTIHMSYRVVDVKTPK